MTFRTIFDAAQSGYTTWWFPAHALIFVCLGALFLLWPRLVMKVMPIRGPDLLDFLELLQFWPIRARRRWYWGFLTFAMLLTLLFFATTYGEYRSMIAALRDGRCAVVEGRVTDFVPKRHSGHSEESFVVGGRRFAWSEDIVSIGFHNDGVQGGLIHDGLYVRVTYLGGVILRLEIGE
jgi:hypothetical protein